MKYVELEAYLEVVLSVHRVGLATVGTIQYMINVIEDLVKQFVFSVVHQR